jgi:hypothetical protein
MGQGERCAQLLSGPHHDCAQVVIAASQLVGSGDLKDR